MASTPVLRYPQDIINYDTDYVKINVVDYKAPGVGSSGDGFNVNRSSNVYKQKKVILGTIILPMPTNLSDKNAVKWDANELNSIAAGGIEALKGIVDSTNLNQVLNDPLAALENVGNSVTGSLETFLKGLDDNVRTQLSNALIAEAANVFGANVDAQSIISRETGQILNPNTELLFRGIELRNLNFNFDMTPRNQREGNEVKSIINTFKRRMAPKTNRTGSGGDGIFISAPDVFEIQFMRGGNPHPFLYKMKVSALKSMNTNYTGTGSYATYTDGTPVKLQMTLQFQELDPIYSEDYDDVTEGVGF